MGYIDDNIMPGERITYRAYLHWIIWLEFSLWLLATLLLLGLVAVVSGSAVAGLFRVVTALVAIFTLIKLLQTVIEYRTSEFGVTNRRVLMKTGFIRRRTFELVLSRLESVEVAQGIAARLLRYGGVTVTGTGAARGMFRRIAAPLEFRRQVYLQLQAAQDAEGTAAPRPVE